MVPTARSTVLPPPQRSKKAAVAPWSNAVRTAVEKTHGGPSEDHSLHPHHRTDHLRQDHARTQKKNTVLSGPTFPGKKPSARRFTRAVLPGLDLAVTTLVQRINNRRKHSFMRIACDLFNDTWRRRPRESPKRLLDWISV